MIKTMFYLLILLVTTTPCIGWSHCKGLFLIGLNKVIGLISKWFQDKLIIGNWHHVKKNKL